MASTLSPEYASWLDLRPALSSTGGLPPVPPGSDDDSTLEHHRMCFEHMHDLVNSQALETGELLAQNVEVRDIVVPGAISKNKNKDKDKDNNGNSDGNDSAVSFFSEREEDDAFSSSESADVKVRVFIPCNNKGATATIGPYPLVIYCSSGGFTMGNERTEEATCRSLCALSKSVVASVVYRRGSPFPAAHEDAWNAFKWLIKNASSPSNGLLADPSGRGLYVAGSSTGALLASYVLTRSRDEGLRPPICGMLLRSPVLLPGPDSAPEKLSQLMWATISERHRPAGWNHHHSPLHTPGLLSRCFEKYCIPTKVLDHPYLSPLLYDVQQQSRGGHPFPPIYIQVSSLDITAHHAHIFASRLTEQGCECKLDVYEGFPHYFWALPRMKRSSHQAAEMAKGLLWMEAQGTTKVWDSGIHEEVDTTATTISGIENGIGDWCKVASKSEGVEAFSTRKLCRINGCGCFM